jgi:hypothetical protein
METSAAAWHRSFMPIQGRHQAADSGTHLTGSVGREPSSSSDAFFQQKLHKVIQ